MNNTLKTLSETTGYSISTISRVLSGKGKQYRISESAMQRILEEANKLNFRPNSIAQSLRTEKTYTLGLVIPNLSNSYFSNIASVIIREARNEDYRVIILDTMENEENEQEAVDTLLSHKADGILLVPCGADASRLEQINSLRTPVLLIDRYFPESELTHIATDNYRGACMATEHLISNGHKDILCLQGIPHSSPNKERVRGYRDTLAKYGYDSRLNIRGNDFSFESGYLQTRLILNNEQRPSAIFALSNTILLGAMKAIREAHLRIPEDISIISFDNEAYLDLLDPPISRISQPSPQIASLAVHTLIGLMKGEKKEPILLPPTLIPGESVRNLFIG